MTSLSDFKGQPIEQLLLETQMGQVVGASVIWKFGQNSAVGTSEVDIWSNGTAYSFPSTAATLDLVSTNLADTSEIAVVGLDANYTEIIEFITLTGTTPVTTANQFLRVNRAYNNSGTPLIGTVTASQGANVLAEIQLFNEQTEQAIYTVPANHTAYVFKGMASTGKGKDAQIYFKIRQQSKVFRTYETFGLYQNTYDSDRPFLPISEKSDIKVSAVSSSAGTPVSAQFGILLLNNTTWKD